MAEWPGTPAQSEADAPQWPGSPAPLKITVTKGEPAPVEQPPEWPGTLMKAIEPITSYFPTQQRMAREGFDQAAQGVSDLRPQSLGGPQGGTAGAMWDVVAGGLKYATSPVEAGIETVVGKPIEENFGIPKEYPQLAAALAIPYYGLRGGAAQTGAKKIFTPEALGPDAERAAGAVRSAQGVAARDTTSTATALERHYPAINELDTAGQLDLIRYMEGGGGSPPAHLAAAADTMKQAFELRKAKLQALPEHAQAQFIDDYFPHFWQDPNAAANFAVTHSGGVGKQGSGASLKKRTMPTIEAGIQAGLTPLITHPIEATMRYVNSMDKFIAQQRVLGDAVRDGTVRFVQPKTMGASGHPESFKVPSGYVPLEGRGATNATGGRAYAPENWARIYNNFHSQGVERFGSEYGNAYNAARQASNAVTALELSFSGYHSLTMAQEAIVNELARAIQQGGRRGGNPGRAMLTAIKSPLAPFTLARTGGKVERTAVGGQSGGPEMERIVDILTEAGARFKGREHAADLGASAMGSFFKAWQRGSLKTELLADAALAGQGTKSTAAVVARNVGRTMDTVMQPIFEVYIPKLKNGAAYENMSDWLRANPTATREETLAAARKIVDSVDNRFGEMIQDNLFWNRFLKQSAMLSLRSYSWTMGSIREIAGGATDTLAGMGRGPQGMTQRQAYVIALPIVYGFMGGTYQYLKTGEPPQNLQDLKAPRTGGTDASTGEPERIVPPGYMKDVFGWTGHPRQEFSNKIATAPRLAWQTAFTGRDWRGDPIAPPQEDETSVPANVPSWLKAYTTHVVEALGPISVKNAAKGSKEGSNLNSFERILGLQPAGMEKTSPEGFEVMMRRKEFKEWRRKQLHDEMEKSKYKGPGSD